MIDTSSDSSKGSGDRPGSTSEYQGDLSKSQVSQSTGEEKPSAPLCCDRSPIVLSPQFHVEVSPETAEFIGKHGIQVSQSPSAFYKTQGIVPDIVGEPKDSLGPINSGLPSPAAPSEFSDLPSLGITLPNIMSQEETHMVEEPPQEVSVGPPSSQSHLDLVHRMGSETAVSRPELIPYMARSVSSILIQQYQHFQMYPSPGYNHPSWRDPAQRFPAINYPGQPSEATFQSWPQGPSTSQPFGYGSPKRPPPRSCER